MKALQKLLNQQINLGVALGERAETFELIASTAKRIYRGFTAAKRMDPEGVLKGLIIPPRGKFTRSKFKWKDPADIWLEAQYGWKPLLQDVHGAITAIDNRNKAGPPRVDVKAKSYEKSYNHVKHGKYSTGRPSFQVVEQQDLLVGCTVHLTYEEDNPYLITAAQLGLVNPAEVVWELVPWSFAVDWFIPVGPWIQSTTAAIGWRFKGGSKTTISRRWGKWLLAQTNWLDFPASYYTYGNGFSRLRLDRTVYYNSPIPNLWDLATPKGLAGHPTRSANAAALAVGKLVGLVR
jgi:hypothetical protein